MGRFQTTRWSLVLAAGEGSEERSRRALADLFEGYWYPVYGFVRGQGYREEDARDVVQSYFAAMLESGSFRGLRPEAGRFRSFLLASMRNFLSHEREHRRAQKRGGDKVIESLDTMTAEARLAREPYRPADAEQAFERRWAATVVQRAMERLEREFESADQTERFRLLRGQLTGEETLPYAELALRLDVTEAGVKSIVRRMRKRFGVLLRGEVRETVNDDVDVDREIRDLLTLLSGP